MNNRHHHRGFDPEAFFGPHGPFGPRGPFGITPEMIFGRQGPFGSAYSGWGEEDPRGPGRGPGRGQGSHRGRARRARRGDVRNAILTLLEQEPMNGYQIMQAISDNTDGAWQPSSGSVYPALSLLEDEGLIEQVEVEGRKAYQLTDTGQAAAQDVPDLNWGERGAEPQDPWAQDRRQRDAGPRGGRGRRGGREYEQGRGRRSGVQLWKGLANLAVAVQAVGQSGDEDLLREATEQVEQVRRDLYRLLAESEISRFDDADDVDDVDDDYGDDDDAQHPDEPEYAEGEIVED